MNYIPSRQNIYSIHSSILQTRALRCISPRCGSFWLVGIGYGCEAVQIMNALFLKSVIKIKLINKARRFSNRPHRDIADPIHGFVEFSYCIDRFCPSFLLLLYIIGMVADLYGSVVKH